MHNIRTNFTKILEVIDIIGNEINEKSNYLRHGTRPKFSDIEVISLTHIAGPFNDLLKNQPHLLKFQIR